MSGEDGELDLTHISEINSRSAVRLVHAVISRFDSRKAELVRSIGFGGLLHFPSLFQINRRLSLWLMTKVDDASRSIVVDNCRRYSFAKDDVALVFGIPSAGEPIRDVRPGNAADYDDLDFVHSCLGLRSSKGCRSIKDVQEILDRKYADGMSKQEVDAFKVAFVVFVMSTLLAPASKHDSVMTDYWLALASTDKISQYDWCSYVIDRLLLACSKLKSDIRKKLNSVTISGCSLFLQILYLDSVNLGDLSIAHKEFPRCRCFTNERFRFMAIADMVSGKPNCNFVKFGASMPRPAAEVSYTWAKGLPDAQKAPTGTEQLFDAARSIVSAANVPQASVPIYVALMLHNKEIQSFDEEQTGKLLDVITTIVRNVKEGFRYSFPAGGLKRPMGTDGDSLPTTGSILKKHQVASSPCISWHLPEGSDRTASYCHPLKTTPASSRSFHDMPAPSFNIGIEPGPRKTPSRIGSEMSLTRNQIHELPDDGFPCDSVANDCLAKPADDTALGTSGGFIDAQPNLSLSLGTGYSSTDAPRAQPLAMSCGGEPINSSGYAAQWPAGQLQGADGSSQQSRLEQLHYHNDLEDTQLQLRLWGN